MAWGWESSDVTRTTTAVRVLSCGGSACCPLVDTLKALPYAVVASRNESAVRQHSRQTVVISAAVNLLYVFESGLYLSALWITQLEMVLHAH